MRRPVRRLILPCVVILAAGMATVACGTDSVSGPSSGRAPLTSHVTGKSDPSQIVACTRREHQVGSATIGPPGGTLIVGENMLIVPPGALTEWVTITGEVPEGTAAAIHFQPSGLVFKKPAALFLNSSGCDLPTVAPDIVYFDDSGEILERIQAVYSKWWKRVIAPITHFSGYAIAV